MVNRDRLVENFLRLAAINSPSLHEAAVADVIEAQLREIGFETHRDDAGSKIGADTGNLIGVLKGDLPDAMPIMFSAHMDTVVPTEGWGYKIEDGVIYSLGNTILGADDKAGIAAILEAVRIVREQGIQHGDIEILFSISEETGLCGAGFADMSGFKAKCAFVYDMGKPLGCVTVAAPTHNNIKAEIHGRAAHAGANPENGVNAIVAASSAIARMTLGRIDFETTANIGIIEGGIARNVVPELCVVSGEARSRNQEKLDAQTRHMVDTFQNAAEEMGARADVEVVQSYKGFRLAEDSEVVKLSVAAAKRAGIDPEFHETGGGSDANVFNLHGFPAAVIGVGYENAHGVDECMAIADLEKSAEMALAIIQEAAISRGRH
jgi:tripeptide aminopeptidase